MTDAHYLDHNASTVLRPGAKDAVTHVLAMVGNGSSVHAQGRKLRAVIEDARDAVAALCGADRETVVFTSGGTEANNMAIAGRRARRVLVSAIEHPSVIAAANEPEMIPVTRDGVVDLAALNDMLDGDGEDTLVCIMAANNETGVIQPVTEAAGIVRHHGAWLHCDAVQMPGKTIFDTAAMGAHTYAISGHKIGAPAGVGALIIAEPETRLEALIKGGGQERYRRSGTENAVGIAALGAAAAEVSANGAAEAEAMAALRDSLESRLPAGAAIAGRAVERLPNTANIILKGVDSETQVMSLDLAGIAVSAGSACSSGKVRRSAVLDAMGYSEDEAGCAIRVSLGWTSTERDIEAFLTTWSKLSERRSAAA